MVNQINYPTHRISVAKIPPKEIQSGGPIFSAQSPSGPSSNCTWCGELLLWFGKLQRSLGSFSNTGKSWKQERWESVLNGGNEPPNSVKTEGRVTCSLQNPQNSSVSTLEKQWIRARCPQNQLLDWWAIWMIGRTQECFQLTHEGWCGFGQQPQPHPIPAHTLEVSKWVCGPIVGTSNSKDNFGRWIGLGILSSG